VESQTHGSKRRRERKRSTRPPPKPFKGHTLCGLSSDGEVQYKPPDPVTETLMIIFTALIKGKRIKVMIDSGATGVFMTEGTAERLELPEVVGAAKAQVTVADGKRLTTSRTVRAKMAAETRAGTYKQTLDFMVLPLGVKVDVILGGSWLRAHSPVTLDYSGFGSIKLKIPNRRDVIIDGACPGTTSDGTGMMRMGASSKHNIQVLNLVAQDMISRAQGNKDLAQHRRSGNVEDNAMMLFAIPRTTGDSFVGGRR
jgi:hypothetical protein